MSKGHIFLETLSPLYKEAQDFLMNTSEPVCRPEHVHKLNLTPCSLYAAAGLSMQTDDIVKDLQRLSKAEIPEGSIQMIRGLMYEIGEEQSVLLKMNADKEVKVKEVGPGSG